MKPNPVKKAVEYCWHRDRGFCKFYSRPHGRCDKYRRDLVGNIEVVERPQWCTNETFVRVKIEPAVVEGVEYCFVCDSKCNMLHDEISDGRLLYSCEIGKTSFTGIVCKKRPEACRKLELP